MTVTLSENPYSNIDLYDKSFPYTTQLVRESDQKFIQQLTKFAMINVIESGKKLSKPKPEVEKFNGVDLPQPPCVIRSNQIELNPYSDHPGCRVQVAAVEAAEKVLCNGAVTDRFIIIHGLAPDIPADCYPNRKSSDPTFYLVDKYAMENGRDCCLVQFWVDIANQCYVPIAFQHKLGQGHSIVSELNCPS
jgi:hypothetical protein